MQKFLHRQRILVTSLLSLLKGRQTTFVDAFSQLLICESSDMALTSSDDELSDWGRNETEFVSKIAGSSDLIDKRILQIYELRLAERAAQHNILENK